MAIHLTRREFLIQSANLVGVAALAPMANKVRRLIPYVNPPEQITPGIWALYATTCRECPAGCGMHLRHRDGRVVKAEGNPTHPLNRGGLCARGQSCVQGLYDPDRVRAPIQCNSAGSGVETGWPVALDRVAQLLTSPDRRVAVMSSLQTGALAEVIAGFGEAFDTDRILFYEPVTYDAQKRAHAMLFGRAEIPDYQLDEADFVLSLGADFLDTWLSPVQFTNRFGGLHSYQEGTIGRMVYVGPSLSVTAGNADEFVCVAPGEEWRVGAAVLNVMLSNGWVRQDADAVGGAMNRLGWSDLRRVPGISDDLIHDWAGALHDARSAVVLGGPACTDAPPAIKAALAAALLNVATGQIGRTVDFSRTWAIGRAAEQRAVTNFLNSLGSQDVLIVIDANPAYAKPSVEEQLRAIGSVIYLGTHQDETAELADWVLPIHSPLEDWGDYEPLTGVHGLVQPGLRPLHDTRSAGDVLLSLAQTAGRPLKRGSHGTVPDFHAWLQSRWQELSVNSIGEGQNEDGWTRVRKQGGFWMEPASPSIPIHLRTDFKVSSIREAEVGPLAGHDLWLWVRPSVMFYDGRVANRGWLQEAPDPVSTLAWGSCADLNPLTAQRLGFVDGQWISLRCGQESIQTPLRITDDVAIDTVLVLLGQGHTALGRQAKGSGANAFRLMCDNFVGGPFGRVEVSPAKNAAEPVYLSASQKQFERNLVQWAALDKLRGLKPGDGEALVLPLPEGYDPKRDLYPPHEHHPHRWAMAVDLQRCTGCGACAVACYAENNVPVVGRRVVAEGREMAWLKIIPYRHETNPNRVAWLPLFCQQCDAAPCEPVCPVFASVHSEEGLNQQVYNRCIGTRYCSNNCPYKVRRFNWFNVKWTPPLDLQLNPDVSVRCRGVMEKCTFCIQRILGAELTAKREGRPVRDGEIQPACAESCPSRAILFGDLLDPASRVTQLTRTDPRRYHVLETLNTKPAVTYLHRILRDKA